MALLPAVVAPNWQTLAQTPVKPVIIAYVFPRNELIVPSEIAADKLTHINYAFADVKDGRIVEGFARDTENFKLLADLRRQHPHLRILISVGGWPDFIAQTEMDKIQTLVDFVNLMTYDFRTSDPIAGHHANLYLHPADAKKRSVDSAVREFIAAGVPPAKIVVGVPFYGRAWAGIEGEGTGPYQPGSRPTARIETNYGPLSATLIDRGGFVRMWDSQAQAPYLWNKKTRTFISYDDPESLRLKCAYIRDKGLAGTMFWEYSGDKTGVLLDTLFTSLRGPVVDTPRTPR